MTSEKSPRLTPEQKITALKAKISELEKSMAEKARIARAREGQAARKLRTRQAIILGAMLIDAAANDDQDARKIIGKYFSVLSREQDKDTLHPLIEALRRPDPKAPLHTGQ